jgi:hypothetical protein
VEVISIALLAARRALSRLLLVTADGGIIDAAIELEDVAGGISSKSAGPPPIISLEDRMMMAQLTNARRVRRHTTARPPSKKGLGKVVSPSRAFVGDEVKLLGAVSFSRAGRARPVQRRVDTVKLTILR